MQKIVMLTLLLLMVICVTSAVLRAPVAPIANIDRLDERVGALEQQLAQCAVTCDNLKSNQVLIANGLTATLQSHKTFIIQNRNATTAIDRALEEYYGLKKWRKLLVKGNPPPVAPEKK